ncbi:hypothetical protein A3731_07880 [Roseovarius sp. HI0049]|nr:hypothetical protein A3731_07880 [Roseovarius sp. HI0049]
MADANPNDRNEPRTEIIHTIASPYAHYRLRRTQAVIMAQSLCDAGAEPGEPDAALRQRLLDAGHYQHEINVAGDAAIRAFREACILPTGNHPGPAGPSS